MAVLHDSAGNVVNSLKPSDLLVVLNPAANTGGTLTLPAAGAGLFHYVTHVRISRAATAALTGSATLSITTTNLPGSLAWVVGNAMAIGGTQVDLDQAFASPIKAVAANTATTIVLPAPGAAVLWAVAVCYFAAA